MKAPVIEIFSSFQGEGPFVGERQIFVRFAGCNLDCSYCDTDKSKSLVSGNLMSVNEVVDVVNSLKTPDCKTVSFTGGEPAIYPEFINEVSKRIDLKILLETNGTLTDNIDSIDCLDIVSLDIKLPEHFNGDYDENIFVNELKSLNLLISKSIMVYCKIVTLPTTKTSTIRDVMKKISENIVDKNELQINIQPASPISDWRDDVNKLFKFSEIAGEYFEVLTIPQIHTILNID